ncbi:hypothetical protein [Micromonospora mirobrigensis]|uniref:HEAT repeat-containing protein n=1 Tax=Micromonospora mirobrigensis TaxID=262898 RepID=A0A1C4VJU4_9ACTN|nr:hypothetical protein [Micromonospora mirobrigensis]SCE84277.1 HEAT repeat-containing protein [Micromonospora mirobrigensis]
MSTQRSYYEPAPTSHETATDALAANDIDTLTDSMVALALHDPDWRWCQDFYLRLLDHPEEDVRASAAICLSHLARIHHELDTAKVLPALRARLADPAVGGTVEDAIADILQFLGLPPGTA